MRSLLLLILILSSAAGVAGCAGEDIFPAIGTSMASPISVAVDSVRSRLYVVNSNYKVSYETGSLHVVDITLPASPVFVGNADLPDFGGQIYLDVTNLLVYTPSRYSTGETDTVDTLSRVNVDEASADFLVRSDYPTGDDPFGIRYYEGGNRILVATEAGLIDYYNLDNNLEHASLSLTTLLSSNVTLSGAGSTRVAVLGTNAVVTNSSNGLWVVNLDDLGVSGTYPVAYYIADIASPRGIDADGTYIYVVDVEYPGGTLTPTILVLDLRNLPARSDNTKTEKVYIKDDNGDFITTASGGLVVAAVGLGDTDPQEVVVAGGKAYVSDFGGDKVSILTADPVGGAFSKDVDVSVGDEPYGMAVYSPADTPTHLFVANSGLGAGGNSVSVIDLTLSPPSVVGVYP